MNVAATLILLAAVSAGELWQRATRETNSHAAAKRGVASYSKQRYAEAERLFATATSTVSSPRNAFNLGTAQIAAGHRAEGSATLQKAMADSALRPAALYNRGNSALASSSFDHAIRDFTESLKLRPGDARAKRNLEIALARNEAQRQSQSGKSQQQQQQQPSPAEQPADKGEAPQQEGDAESLLRSVQQQEQEEMQRMKRARARSARVGW